MKKTKLFIYHILFFKIFLQCYNSAFTAPATLNFCKSIKYSLIELTSDYSPTSNTNISIVQSPGLKFSYCDLSQTSVPTSQLAMSLINLNRFGSRFCSSDLGQIYITAAHMLVKNLLETSWSSYCSSLSSNINRKVLTTTTYGLCATITLPPSEATNAIDCLANICTRIQNLNITTSDVNTAFTNSKNDITTNAMKSKLSNAISSNALEHIKLGILRPKEDVSAEYGRTAYDGNGSITGSLHTYSLSLITSLMNTTRSINQLKYLFSLYKTERSFLLFGASSNTSVKPNIISLAIRFAKITNPNEVSSLSESPIYGFSTRKGTSHSFDQPNTSGQGGFGIVLNLGPITKNALLAGTIIAKLTSSGSISPVTSSCFVDVLIFAGMVQARIVGGLSSGVTSGTTNILSSYCSSLSSRYSTTSNDSDFTTHSSIVNEISKQCTPGSSGGQANFTDSGFFDFYENKAQVYLFWMEMFYGAYGVPKQLRDLTSTTSQEKANALKQAALEIINTTNCSTSQSFYFEIT